ncbi:MAG: oligosaccharide flippase family protein [Sedimentisphaerales bacterium]|nr:oligosaccharide flippase family protein [Sedimentisphaerales bacterium]
MINRIPDKIRFLRSNSLKAKSARGVLTLGIGTGFERTLRFVRTMILARILLPNQFGLMAIILTLVNVFESFTEVGVKQSVIQNKRGDNPEYLNVAWWFQAVRGLGLFTIAILAAPLVSSFYDKPNLLKLLQVSFLAILFRGFISPRAHVLQREYKFGRSVLLLQGSALLGTIVTICIAFYTKDIWSLVIGYVSEQGILCLLSYILVPFVPKFSLDRECLRELVIFARGMFGLPILTIIGPAISIFVLGKIVTDQQLGMYSLASQLASLPTVLFSKIIGPVLLPGFSQKQEDRNSLYRVVLEISRMIAALIIPLVAYMIACASGLLLFAWGRSEYVSVTIPCAVLSVIILARTETAILGATYIAVGQPRLQRRYVILRAMIVIVLIYPAALYFKLLGAAVVAVLANYIAMLMQIFWCKRVIPLKFERYLRCYIPGLLMAFPPILTIHSLLLLGVDSLAVILIVAAAALIVTYSIYFGNILFLGNNRVSLSPN